MKTILGCTSEMESRRLVLAVRTAVAVEEEPKPHRFRHSWAVTLRRGASRGEYVRIIRCARCDWTMEMTLASGGLRRVTTTEPVLERVLRAVDIYLRCA